MKRRDKYHPLDEEGEYLTGPALYDELRRQGGNTVLLSFSRGKDSIATWLELRDHGFEIIPFYCYIVPGGLSYELESLDYYERYFGRHIYRCIHSKFWDDLNDCMFQPPQRVRSIMEFAVRNYDYKDLADGIAAMHGLASPYVAFGYRMHDNAQRRLLVLREGPMGLDNYRYIWPIWDWRVNQVAERIKGAGVALPADYTRWGWTLTATVYRYLKPLRDHYPEDWEKLKYWFPLIDAEFFRYERVGRHA